MLARSDYYSSNQLHLLAHLRSLNGAADSCTVTSRHIPCIPRGGLWQVPWRPPWAPDSISQNCCKAFPIRLLVPWRTSSAMVTPRMRARMRHPLSPRPC